MAKIIKNEDIEYLFCSATTRPDCTHNNLCCLKCSDVVKCAIKTTTKVKPCTLLVCDDNEVCSFMI